MNGWREIGSLVVGACWGVFAVVWVIGAVVTHARGPRVVRRSGGWWTMSIVIVALLWVSRRFVSATGWRSLTVDATWLTVLGVVILVASTGLTLWARWRLGSMWTASPTIKREHELRTDGPYAITRHPIYTGILGMLIGTGLFAGLGPWLPVLVVTIALIEVKIRSEERLLSGEFPDAYPAYRQRVPQLLPLARRRTRTR